MLDLILLPASLKKLTIKNEEIIDGINGGFRVPWKPLFLSFNLLQPFPTTVKLHKTPSTLANWL